MCWTKLAMCQILNAHDSCIAYHIAAWSDENLNLVSTYMFAKFCRDVYIIQSSVHKRDRLDNADNVLSLHADI